MNEINIEPKDYVLASRGSRLAAYLIDMLTVLPIGLLCAYGLAVMSDLPIDVDPPAWHGYTCVFVVLIAFFFINARFLEKNSQTVGKKVMKIKISNVDGTSTNLNQLFLKRYIFYFLFSAIPILNIINLLPIFGSTSRCLHDYVAGTRVVKC